MPNIKNLSKSKPIKWFLTHSIAIASCVLITGLGITFLAWSSSGVTTIGEDIRTRNIIASGDVTVSGSLGAKTGRTATIVVAASNSSPTSRAQADFVADGVDDQVEIQAAIDALHQHNGGKVLLTEGTFTTNSHLLVRTGVSLEGVGWATIIRLRDGANITHPHNNVLIFMESNTSLYNLTGDGNMLKQVPRTQHVVAILGSNVSISGTQLLNAYSILVTGESAPNARIIGNHIIWTVPDTITLGDAISADSDRLVVMGNTIVQALKGQGIDVQGASHVTVVGNIIRGGTIGVELHSPITEVGNVINGNTFDGPQYSIIIRNNRTFTVTNNTLVGVERFGIRFFERPSFDGVISSNAITTTGVSADTSLICISNASERIQIVNNSLKTTSPVGKGIHIFPSAIQTHVKYNVIRGFDGTKGYVNRSTFTIDSQQFVELFMDVVVASTTYVHPLVAYDGTVRTVVTSPDVPRNISASLRNSATVPIDTVATDATITGVDARGNPITEVIRIPAVAGLTAGAFTTAFGSKAFATVSQIQFSIVTQPAETQMSVGISNRLGLNNPIYLAGDVFKVKRNIANISVGAVDIANRTVDVTTVTDGDDFTIYYRSNLNTAN